MDRDGRMWRAEGEELLADPGSGPGIATVDDLERAAATEIVALSARCDRLNSGQAIRERAEFREALVAIANSDEDDALALRDIARKVLRNMTFESYCTFRVEVVNGAPPIEGETS